MIRINIILITSVVGYMFLEFLGALLGVMFGLEIISLLAKKVAIWEMESTFIQYTDGCNNHYIWRNGERMLLEYDLDFIIEPISKPKNHPHFRSIASFVFFKLFKPSIFFISNVVRVLFHLISSTFQVVLTLLELPSEENSYEEFSDSFRSLEVRINPATGLRMRENSSFDVSGNLYGSN